jgi:hypothetical protein
LNVDIPVARTGLLATPIKPSGDPPKIAIQ